jgi:hypothetical protein
MAWDVARRASPTERGLGGVRMSQAGFMNASARHRFCIVAPGDKVGTGKIGETVAIAAAGGYLPVFMMPDSPLGSWGTQILFKAGRTTQGLNQLPAGHRPPRHDGHDGADRSDPEL